MLRQWNEIVVIETRYVYINDFLFEFWFLKFSFFLLSKSHIIFFFRHFSRLSFYVFWTTLTSFRNNFLCDLNFEIVLKIDFDIVTISIWRVLIFMSILIVKNIVHIFITQYFVLTIKRMKFWFAVYFRSIFYKWSSFFKKCLKIFHSFHSNFNAKQFIVIALSMNCKINF